MHHVGIFEAAQHVRDGVDFADVGEELIAETLTLGGAPHQAGDVDEGEPGRHDLCRIGRRAESGEPRIGHRERRR